MIFPPRYFGSVRYYAAMARSGHAVIDLGHRYDKREKEVHRTVIAGARGPLTLTVPVSHPKDVALRTWGQLTVSSHGAWWNVHRVSLESAYGRTPYFEFYIDRFMPWLTDTDMPVSDFCRGLDAMVRATLSLPVEVEYNEDGHPAGRPFSLEGVSDVPYYQVRADRLGFLPGLSILDLIFNMGPEAVLILQRMAGL